MPGIDRGVLREVGSFIAEHLDAFPEEREAIVQLLHFPPGSGRLDPWGHLLDLLEAGDRWAWR